MGSSSGPEDEQPQHRVQVGEFSIDRTKVTHAQFAQFLNSAGLKGARGKNISIATTMMRGFIGAAKDGLPIPDMKIGR